jgi:hypothetical protein
MAYLRKHCAFIGCSKTSSISDKFWRLKEWRGFPTSSINTVSAPQFLYINPLVSKDLSRRRAMSPLKIKIPSKNMREKPTNTPTIQSVY